MIKAGQRLPVDLVMANVGYAAPYNPGSVQLVLRNVKTGNVHAFTVASDLRRLLPGTHRLRSSVKLDNVEPERYELLLNLPDGYASLAKSPAYSKRLANEGLWEVQTGYNKLNSVLTIR